MSKNRDLGNYGSAALLDAHSEVVANTVVQRTANGDINANNVNASTITGTLSGSATSLATARTITLGGDLSGSASFDGTANVTITATVADDSHNHIIGNVDGLQDALDLKAPLASPTLTGVPAAPTANAGTNTTQIATTAFVQTAVAGIVDTAPETLDTLNELAAALGDDPNFATTVSNSIGGKAPLTGEGTSGTWGISITGNANTVTNGVYTTGDQTIGGTKTFSSDVYIAKDVPVMVLHDTDSTGANIFSYISFRDSTFTEKAYVGYSSTLNTDFYIKNVFGNVIISADRIITENGDVGIGTSSPLYPLHINRVIGLSSIGLTGGATGATNYRLMQGILGITNSGFSVYDLTNSATRMVINPSGNVGIGTTNPDHKLSVESAEPATRVQVTNSSNAAAGAGIYMVTKSGGTIVSNATVRTDNAGNFSIFSGTSTDTERLRIASGGNVGIGTSSPSAKLHVHNNIAGQGLIISGDDAGIGTDVGLQIRKKGSATVGAYIFLDSDDNETLDIEGPAGICFNGTSGVERMRINTSGHVLPGTNATQDLGSSTLRWNTVYTSDLSLKNDHGDWTIVEGEDDLFLYNNKKGKVYKFALTEVDPSIAPAKRD